MVVERALVNCGGLSGAFITLNHAIQSINLVVGLASKGAGLFFCLLCRYRWNSARDEDA